MSSNSVRLIRRAALSIAVLAAFARLMLRRPGIAERAAALTADFAIVELNADRLKAFKSSC